MSVQRDIDVELRFHLESRVDELMQQGTSREQARAQAIAEFGDVDVVRAGLREIDRRTARRRDRTETLSALFHDVRYAARALLRTPLVSLTIVLTLALGVGVNAAMFSLLDVMYFRAPAGVAEPGMLRRVWAYRPSDGFNDFHVGFDYHTYEGIAAQVGPNAHAATYMGPDTRRLGRGENAPMVPVAGVSTNYFDVLGVKAQRGRLFTDDEAGPGGMAPVAVISDALWRRSFNHEENVVGRPLQLGPQRFTIVGVMAPRFRGIDAEATDVWLSPAAYLLTAHRSMAGWWHDTHVNAFQVFMRTDSNIGDAALTAQLTRQLRSPGGDWRGDPKTVAALGAINVARGPSKRAPDLAIANRLAAVSIVVLLIACANVVNLLLARAANRRREIAVRLALGISRARLVRLLVAESGLLAIVAALAAVIAAAWGGAVLRTLLMPNVEWAVPAMHWRVMVFALCVSLATGVLAGLGPALQASSPRVADALRSGTHAGPDRSRLRSVLVGLQTALSLVLLVGAALFIRSLRNAMAFDVGYTVDRVVFASAHYDAPDSVRDAQYSQRLQSLRPQLVAIPGVQNVAFTSSQPNYSISFTGVYFPDAETSRLRKPLGTFTAVSRDFFATTGIRFIYGTTFADTHGAGPLSVVINRALADALWPRENPVGRCVRFERADAPCATIVGVVQSAIVDDEFSKTRPHFYISIDHPAVDTWGAADVVVRADPRHLATIEASIRRELGDQFPGALRKVTTMAEIMAPQYRPWVLGATLFTVFGVLALVVAAIGVYSTVSYSVSRRTHEFGVRMALGARASDVLQHVIGGELRTIAVGLAIGVVLTIAGGRLVASLLYDVRPSDPLSIAIVAVVLVTIAMIAALAPAWRASRVDPVSALRAE